MTCHQCNKVRDDEASCNQQGFVDCNGKVCRSDVFYNRKGNKIFYSKGCARLKNCPVLNQPFLDSGKYRICCSNEDTCNSDASLALTALTGPYPGIIFVSEMALGNTDGVDVAHVLYDLVTGDSATSSCEQQIAAILQASFAAGPTPPEVRVSSASGGTASVTIQTVLTIHEALDPVHLKDTLTTEISARGISLDTGGATVSLTLQSLTAQQACYPNHCENGGMCTPGGPHGFTCSCGQGFGGISCQTASSTDDCVNNQCVNGQCVDGVDTYTCTCDAGWTDQYCDQPLGVCDAVVCENSGTCLDLGVAICQCVPGYGGDFCEINQDDCINHQCVNGQCVDGLDAYTCTCDPGWTGHFCDQQGASWCGVSKYPDAAETQGLLQFQIVGGDEARPNEFPWQVSFQWPSLGDYHYCGGGILNSEWILTAAHCSVYVWEEPTVGDHNLFVVEASESRHTVEEVVTHPLYDAATLDNDIALVRVSPPIEFTENVQPLCPPDINLDYTGSTVYVSGWGKTYQDGVMSDVLQYATLVAMDNAACTLAYNGVSGAHITETKLCTTDNAGATTRDSCEGDSGGVVFAKDTDGTFQAIAVVSYGVGCADGYPGVNTRVTSYLNWINSAIENQNQ